MEDYPSNSHKSRAERMEPVPEKKVEKVISGDVKTRNRNGLQRFADALISDGITDLKSYILKEVILPKARDMIFDAITNSAEMVLYGKEGRRNKNANTYQTSYRSYYNDSRRDTSRDWKQERPKYEDIIFSNRGEAEKVLDEMDKLIDMYNMVSVADLYELVGISGSYTDNKYGWTSLRSAEVIRIREGYILKLPKAIPLD